MWQFRQEMFYAAIQKYSFWNSLRFIFKLKSSYAYEPSAGLLAKIKREIDIYKSEQIKKGL